MQEAPFEELSRISSSFQQSCVLAAAAELDCCTAILERGNRVTTSELAAALVTDARGTGVLLDALAAIGIVVKTGTGESAVYAVSERFESYMDSRHPASFIPIIRHLACVQRNWTQLAKVVKSGEQAVPQPSILGSEQDRVSFIMGMNSIALTLVDSTVDAMDKAGLLSFDKDEPAFIDVGGASGTYTLAFLQKLPRSRGTIFDLPVGIAQAQKRFTGTELEQRISLVTGDFDRDDLPQGFDFAWVSAIIHQMGRNESRALYRKVFQSLLPGGRISVRDFMMSPERTKPLSGAFFGVNMLVNTRNGMVYTLEEVTEDLMAAGFTEARLAVPAESMSAVVSARKPG